MVANIYQIFCLFDTIVSKNTGINDSTFRIESQGNICIFSMAMILYILPLCWMIALYLLIERKVRTQSPLRWTKVAGNARIGKPKRCEQKRQCRKARIPSGIVLSRGRNATAKSLPLSKTRAQILGVVARTEWRRSVQTNNHTSYVEHERTEFGLQAQGQNNEVPPKTGGTLLLW